MAIIVSSEPQRGWRERKPGVPRDKKLGTQSQESAMNFNRGWRSEDDFGEEIEIGIIFTIASDSITVRVLILAQFVRTI